MNKILDKLNDWANDIAIDLRAEWPTQEERLTMLRQHTELLMAIGILNGLGPNNNILR